jgi:hypothetical protein
MSQRTRVYLICSPRPKAGKTLSARLCAEFQSYNTRPVLGFDLSVDQPRFAEFLPTLVTAASISDVRGQMALFDKLATNDGNSKVVDIGYRVFETFFTIMRDLDFAAEVRRNAISAIVLFVAAFDESSIHSYRTLRNWFPALTFVPIYNEAIARGRELGRMFTSNNHTIFPLQIAELPFGLQNLVDQPPFSFHDSLTPPSPLALKWELDGWVRRGWRQFRELELSLLLDELKSSFVVQNAGPAQPKADRVN